MHIIHDIKKHLKKASLLACSVLWLILMPGTAQAVQVHGPPEGVIVHLMGHIFFFAALLFLIYILNKYPVDSSKAWRYFKISIFFWLVWNIDTFVNHILALRLDKSAIIIGRHHIFSYLAGPLTLEKWVYYLGQFDHFLCIPAMWSLSMSLRYFCKRVEKQTAEETPGAQVT